MKTLIAKILILAVLASSAVIVPNTYSQDKNPRERKAKRYRNATALKRKIKNALKISKEKNKHKLGNKRGGRK
jgi:hypothetical protein